MAFRNPDLKLRCGDPMCESKISAAWAVKMLALGAGEVVLGEGCYLLEEAGARRVVKEPGWEGF